MKVFVNFLLWTEVFAESRADRKKRVVSRFNSVFSDEVDEKKLQNAVNKVTEEIGINEHILSEEISEPRPSEEIVSEEEYQELIQIGAIEEPPPISYKTFSRHYTDRTVCPEFDSQADSACSLKARTFDNDHDRLLKNSHSTCVYNCDNGCPHKSCKETGKLRRRRESGDLTHKIKRVLITLQFITSEVFNKTNFAEKTTEELKAEGLSILQIIPNEPNNSKYFWTQQFFLVVALCFSTVFIFFNTRTFGKLSVLSSVFLAVVPLLDILPPVFVWYEYNTDPNLAVDPVDWVSNMLIFFAFIKLFNHVGTLIIVLRKKKSEDETMFVILYKVLVEYRILDEFLLKAVDLWLVYFYFARFLVHGSPVSNATYVSVLCTFVVNLPRIISVLSKGLQWILNKGCFKDSLELAEEQKAIKQTSADCTCAPLTQGIFTLIYRATQASILFSSFFIFLNDYIIDYCVDYNDDNEMKKWICSKVDDQSMSILKGRITVQGQCFDKKINKADMKSFRTLPLPFNEGCMITTEFVIVTLSIWIVIASAVLFVGICLNLPPVSFTELKEKLGISQNKPPKETENIIIAEQTTLMNPDIQKA